MVTVSVADSSGDDANGVDTIIVTISVTNVDEPPSVTGAKTIEHVEGGTVLDTNLATEDDAEPATYTAMDVDADTALAFSLSGADGDKFELTGMDPIMRTLAFKAAPDFENPGDSDRDNVYEVTVVVSDGVNNKMQADAVKVTNMEEMGIVTVTPKQPRDGVELTAVLKDSDGIVTAPVWEWRIQETVAADGACADIPVDDAGWGDDATVISGATSATYTPVSEDDGKCLRVRASYTDAFYREVADPRILPDGFDEEEVLVLPAKIQKPSENVRPKFSANTAERYVPEDAIAADNVGDAVIATDPNDDLGDSKFDLHAGGNGQRFVHHRRRADYGGSGRGIGPRD